MDHSHHDMDTSSDSCCSDPKSDAMDHGDEGGHGGMGGCKISMLLNYNTIDSCFISEDWRITSAGMFAGSCIGIFLLAIFLEFLRRAVKQFDRYLIQQHQASHAAQIAAASNTPSPGISEGEGVGNGNKDNDAVDGAAAATQIPPFRPNFWQQGLRAILHTSQFTVAYFIMLLAMYYNVYVLTCIFLGILVGSYIFQYETLDLGQQVNSGGREPTVCCG